MVYIYNCDENLVDSYYSCNGDKDTRQVSTERPLNTLRLRRNGHHFADNNAKPISLYKKYCIVIQISLKGLINN